MSLSLRRKDQTTVNKSAKSKTWFNVFVLVLALCMADLFDSTGLAAPPFQEEITVLGSGFCDNFGNATLDPGWTWIDPFNTSNYSLTERPGSLTISIPSGAYYIGDGTVPRIVQPVSEDFVVTTKITKDHGTCWGAGLVAWQDADHYLAVEIGDCGESSNVYVIYEAGAGGHHHEIVQPYEGATAYARLTRAGDSITGSYSIDGGVTWLASFTAKYTDVSFFDVGLYVTGWQSDGEAYFDYFEIDECLPDIAIQSYPPVSAPRARVPIAWELGRGNTANETYVLWDTVSRVAQYDYAYHTDAQRGGLGVYNDAITIPDDVEAIYFKPYAEIDGQTVYAEDEYVTPIRRAINVGAEVWGEDESGQYWDPDRDSDFSPTYYEITGGEPQTTAFPIANTVDDWIYQSQREGISQFSAWVGDANADMTFQVQFYLAELEATAAGQRVFDIYLERGTADEVALRNVDVYALAGGRNRATALTATVHVAPVSGVNEDLTIDFVSRTGEPILNGLAIRGLNAVGIYEAVQQPNAGSDDTFCDAQGTHLTDAEVWIGGDAQYHGGLRFEDLHIPQGAIIHSAQLSMTASADASGLGLIEIYAHADDSSPTFDAEGLVQDRARTASHASWRLSGIGWQQGEAYASPDLSAVVQEVVNRPGWQEGNALSLLLIAQEGGATDASRRFWSYEGSYDDRAELKVYYSRLEDMPTQVYAPLLLGD